MDLDQLRTYLRSKPGAYEVPMALFHALQRVVSDTVEHLVALRDDVRSKPLSWKRDALAPFVHAFAQLRNLEAVLGEAVDEFMGIAVRGATVTKVVPRQKLVTVAHEMKNVGDSVISVYGIYKLTQTYPNPYLYPLLEIKSYWLKEQRVVNLFPLACPEMLVEDHQTTYVVRYPYPLPTPLLPPAPDNIRLHQERPDAAVIQEQARQQLSYATVDIRDRAALAAALGDTATMMQQVRQARRSFATFIREEFPIDEILMDDGER